MPRALAACLLVAALAVFATAVFLRDATRPAPPAPAKPTPREASAAYYRAWRLETEALAERARRRPGRTVFRNPPRSVLRARLRATAARYDFRVRRLTVLQPLGEAPVIVVQTERPRRFGRRLSQIVEAIAPTGRIGRWPDPAYEALYLEALDGSGVPFLATYRRWRGEAVGGGLLLLRAGILPQAIPPQTGTGTAGDGRRRSRRGYANLRRSERRRRRVTSTWRRVPSTSAR